MVFIEVQPVPGLSLMRQSDSNWHDSSLWEKKRKRKLLWVCNLSFSILLIEHVEQDNGGVSSVTQIQPSVLLIGMIVVYGKKKKEKENCFGYVTCPSPFY